MTHALASKWLGVSERMDFDNSQPARLGTHIRAFSGGPRLDVA